MAKHYYDDTDYKIGRSLTTLITLRDLGIAVPDQVVYQPSSSYYVRGDLTRVGDGFTTVSWVWDIISIDRIARLLEILDGGSYANVYIKTDVRDGTFAIAKNAFKVYSAIMWKPLLFGQEGTPVARSPYTLQTVNIQFVNLVEQVGYL